MAKPQKQLFFVLQSIIFESFQNNMLSTRKIIDELFSSKGEQLERPSLNTTSSRHMEKSKISEKNYANKALQP